MPGQQMTMSEYNAGLLSMASSALHFIADEPGLIDRFAAWLNEGRDRQVGTPRIRQVMAEAHDLIAPGCDEPIGPVS